MDNGKVIIVAEITANHCGNLEKAKKIILEAKRIGFDMVKFQKRDVLNFYPEDELKKYYKSPFGETFQAYRLGIELGQKEFKEIDRYCKDIGISWFASALDTVSVDFLLPFDLPFIKIPGTVSQDADLYRYLAGKSHKQVVLSTGGCALKEVRQMLELMKEKETVFLLQTTNAYPPTFDKVNLGVIRYFRENLAKEFSNVVPGYSSHELEMEIPLLAVASGARMIEKHFTIEQVDWIHYSDLAFTPDKMERLIQNIRKTEKILGSEEKYRDEVETHKYEFRNTGW